MLGQWAYWHRHAIDPPVSVVAAGVTHVVLHVSDDDVLPISYVQCAIFTDNRVSWPKVSIITVEDVLNRSSPNFSETTFVIRGPVAIRNLNVHGCY